MGGILAGAGHEQKHLYFVGKIEGAYSPDQHASHEGVQLTNHKGALRSEVQLSLPGCILGPLGSSGQCQCLSIAKPSRIRNPGGAQIATFVDKPWDPR